MSATSNMSISLRADAWRRLKKDRCAVICFWIVIGFTLLALFGEGRHQYYAWKDITAPINKPLWKRHINLPHWSTGWYGWIRS